MDEDNYVDNRTVYFNGEVCTQNDVPETIIVSDEVAQSDINNLDQVEGVIAEFSRSQDFSQDLCEPMRFIVDINDCPSFQVQKLSQSEERKTKKALNIDGRRVDFTAPIIPSGTLKISGTARQCRKHKKGRINKKWFKRYGFTLCNVSMEVT